MGQYPDPGAGDMTEEEIWQGSWIATTAAICDQVAPQRAVGGLPPLVSGCARFGRHSHPLLGRYRMPEPPPFAPQPCCLLPGAPVGCDIDFGWPLFGL